ncbi:MAG: GHKL domain-containing protein, partial [Lachnospiraceae bacterium]|nr:GHKL domain-containing protein [Lachnospiraceae bacterium]
EFVNYFEYNSMIMTIIYVFVAVYCIHKFHDTLVGALISVLFMLIVISVLQFIIAIPVAILFTESRQLKAVVINMFAVLASWWILPVINLYKLRLIFIRRDTFVNAVFCIILITAFVITVKGKMDGQIDSDTFALATPASIALLILLNKWDTAQEEKEDIKRELFTTKTMQKEYDALLTSVRLREHGFKNHLAALLSIKYTGEFSEEAAKEQEHYYEEIREANKYNRMLFWGNRVVSGYLYQKFQETENAGITVLLELKGHYVESAVPDYYLVEMLGILIDNAVEAQEDLLEEKQLEFQFEEKEHEYCFKILNRNPYVSYAEIESWFLLDNSKKGKGRGLGLYYIKNLCTEYSANLSCRNVENKKKNWIEFSLEIKKAD